MQYTHSDILAMGEGGFFGPGNAQLPSGPMLMVDSIGHLDSEGGNFGKGELRAGLAIRPDHWFFACHFKNDPVMPGCLGLDALWQLLGVFLAWSGLPGRGRALGVGKVKFSGQVYPDAESIEYRLHIRRVFRRPMPMGIADGEVWHQGKRIYLAEELRVGMIP